MNPGPAPVAGLFDRQLDEHRALFAGLHALEGDVRLAAETMARCLSRGGRLHFFGNGGSASDSQHIAAELTGRLRHDRRPLAASALGADAAALTAIGNDYGYEQVYARLLRASARPGDCAIAISTSGRSPNVLEALRAAAEMRLHRIGLLGRDGGAARGLVDIPVVVPHDDTARIQEAHIFIGHCWCAQIEVLLGLHADATHSPAAARAVA